MNVKILRFLLQSSLFVVACSSVIIPCTFKFTPQHGYECRVNEEFENNSTFAHVTDVTGGNNKTFSRIITNRIIFYKLNVLYLPGNLTEFFPHLKALQVKSCGLKNLTRSTELNQLRKYYLGFNDIAEIPVTYFWNFCKLQILSLYGNRISAIPKMAFRDLKSLEKLSLSQNQLAYLHPYLFICTPKLTTIDLDNNHFVQIPSELFADNSHLKSVSFKSNRIVDVGNDFLSNNEATLEHVGFSDNICIKEIFNFPQNNFTEMLKRFNSPTCSPPTKPTTTTQRPTTTPPRKKAPHQRERIFYFENCEWHKPPSHRYF